MKEKHSASEQEKKKKKKRIKVQTKDHTRKCKMRAMGSPKRRKHKT
jgi:hypothetical protein